MSVTIFSGVRIIRVYQDPRVSASRRRRISPAAASLAAEAAAFASAILARYAGRVVDRWAVGFVFRHLAVETVPVGPQPRANAAAAPVDLRLSLSVTQRVEAELPRLRLEPTFPTARLESSHVSASTPSRAVHLVHRAPLEPAREPSPPRQVLGPQGQPVAPGFAQFAPPAPSIDINQLTDQVIKAIDRRIISERERLGRI
jgi:hypothetical protein